MEIAVVVPAYQAASTLGMTLASIAGQEYPAKDVVVVDDCSSDGTGEIVNEWRRTLPIRVIRHHRNLGAPASLRSGVESAASPIVARLDADDVWLPDHLATLASLFGRNGGLVSANSWNWVPGRALAEASWYEKYKVPPRPDELVELARKNWVFGSVLFDRSDHDRVGGFRDMRAGEDWDLFLRLADAGVPITAAPNVTMLYRQGMNTVSKGEKMLLASAALLRDFASTGHEPRAQQRALRTAKEMERRAHLHRSYNLVREGQPAAARANARLALLGVPGTSARAAAVMIAPRASVRLYDRLQSDAKRRVAA